MSLSESFDYFRIQCDELSQNKLFIGFLMILVNIGARFIIDELNDHHRSIVKSDLFRKIIIFSSVFMATRDIIIAFVVTCIFTLLINEVLQSPEIYENKEKLDKQNNSSFLKQELDKQIDQLKNIKDSL